jgi:hypothetical protein
MAERYKNDQGGFGNYGPAYAQRVRKSKRNQVHWGIGTFLAAILCLKVGVAMSTVLPIFGLSATFFVIAWALGGGRSEWLRWLLVLALVGFTGWYIYGVAIMYLEGMPK